MLSFILGFFTDVSFLISVMVGLGVASLGYSAGIFYGLRTPILALIAGPLVVAIGIGIASGSYFYRQGVEGQEVKAKLAQKDREIARQKLVAQEQARQREVAEGVAKNAQARAQEAAIALQQNEQVIDGLRQDIQAGRSTRAPADAAYTRRMRNIVVGDPAANASASAPR